METKMLEERVKKLEIRVSHMEKILSDLSEKFRDVLSPKRKSRDKTSPQCLEWSQPWKPIVGPVFKPAKSFWDFEKRYKCRPLGPTKYINEVVALSMAFPENNNFYVKSTRCYVCNNKKWERMKPKEFYPELREKILAQYRHLLLRSQTEEIRQFATDCLQRASLKHWTNHHMEAMFS